jgi:hypothetical protein
LIFDEFLRIGSGRDKFEFGRTSLGPLLEGADTV